jgi:transposase-like protein
VQRLVSALPPPIGSKLIPDFPPRRSRTANAVELMKNKAVYVALALNPDGEKDVLGLCVDRADRGRQILAQGDQRTEDPGVNDILIAVVDGLKGFPEAIASVYPQTVA